MPWPMVLTASTTLLNHSRMGCSDGLGLSRDSTANYRRRPPARKMPAGRPARRYNKSRGPAPKTPQGTSMTANDVLLVAAITILATIAVTLLALFALAGFDAQRFRLALRACGSILRDAALAEKVKAMFQPAEQKPAKPSGAPLRMLALLQREGRLLDFLLE